MIDISTVGAKVTITPSSGRAITITEFSDEGTPFEASDIDVSTNQKNLNGQMISSRTPAVYGVSVTVIPGSDDDVALFRLLQQASIMPGSVVAVNNLKINSITIDIPGINGSGPSGTAKSLKYTWTNGRIKSGPTGPSSSAEGRQSARTYTFEMEKFSVITGNGVNVENPR